MNGEPEIIPAPPDYPIPQPEPPGPNPPDYPVPKPGELPDYPVPEPEEPLPEPGEPWFSIGQKNGGSGLPKPPIQSRSESEMQA